MSAVNAVIDATVYLIGILVGFALLAGIVWLAWKEPRGKVVRP